MFASWYSWSTPSSSMGKRELKGARESCWRFGKDLRERWEEATSMCARAGELFTAQKRESQLVACARDGVRTRDSRTTRVRLPLSSYGERGS
jgi:hypothetical protein